MDDRHNQLLRALADAPDSSLSGGELANRLGVSSRSIRQYVRDLNRRSGRDIVDSTHRGYRLDRSAYAVWQMRQSGRETRYDTPQQRLYFVVRHLVTQSAEGADVFELGDLVSVSASTIEADLGKARGLFQEHHLTLRRERDLVYLDGSERDKRRLVRQVVLQPGQGMSPTVIQGFADEYSDYDIRALGRGIERHLEGTGLEVDEFALNDLVIHLTIAADRVRQGHELAAPELPSATPDPDTEEVARRIVEEVATAYGVTLPGSETALLTVILRARAKRRPVVTGGVVVEAESLQLVREAMHELSTYYLLDLYDEGTLVGLARHVQSLIERARQGMALENPLGETFKNMHPLIHELTLVFAGELEKRAEITVHPGEVDLLSLHLGTHIQRQLEQGSPVTLTVVVPRYRGAHTEVVNALSATLGDQAVISEVITSLDHPWSGLATDLVVSAVDLSGLTTVPVVTISPLLRQEDVERVVDAVRAERRRAARQRIRSSILTMIEPRLFHRLSGVESKETALALMCRTMHNEGVTPESFYDDVLDREHRSATAFGGQFAIPHSMKMDAHRPAISVLVTDKGIPWSGSTVRLVVLFAVSPDSGGLFRDVLDGFIRVLAEPSNVTALLGASDSHANFVLALTRLLE